MKITEPQWKKIKQFARKKYEENNDSFHGYDHAQAVSGLAEYIAKKEKADVDVCRAAGLLHDIAPKTRGKAHGKQSGDIINKYLTSINLKKDFTDNVVMAVIYHDTINQHLIETLEGEVVFEADKLECFGPVGIIREFGDLIIKGYSYDKSLNQLFDYLVNYNPDFKTKTAKKIKSELKAFNNNFIHHYYKYRKL